MPGSVCIFPTGAPAGLPQIRPTIGHEKINRKVSETCPFPIPTDKCLRLPVAIEFRKRCCGGFAAFDWRRPCGSPGVSFHSQFPLVLYSVDSMVPSVGCTSGVQILVTVPQKVNFNFWSEFGGETTVNRRAPLRFFLSRSSPRRVVVQPTTSISIPPTRPRHSTQNGASDTPLFLLHTLQVPVQQHTGAQGLYCTLSLSRVYRCQTYR